MNKIRVLLIEDNRLLRVGLTAMLNGQPDIEVVAALGNGENAVLKVQERKPDVVLLDLGLRSQNSLRLVELVKQKSPEVKLIVMDLIPVQADIVEFVKAGVSGFILKDATLEDFLRTIRSVAAGAKVLPPPLTGSLFSQIIEQAVGEGKLKLIESVRMTKREREVIELIAEGLSNKEIAQRLNLATYTVKSHVHNILEKLALQTRLQVASYVHTQGTVKAQSDDVPPPTTSPSS
jgi:two-component system response regulator DegU